MSYKLFLVNLYEAKSLEPVLALIKVQFGGVKQAIVRDTGMINQCIAMSFRRIDPLRNGLQQSKCLKQGLAKLDNAPNLVPFKHQTSH